MFTIPIGHITRADSTDITPPTARDTAITILIDATRMRMPEMNISDPQTSSPPSPKFVTMGSLLKGMLGRRNIHSRLVASAKHLSRLP